MKKRNTIGQFIKFFNVRYAFEVESGFLSQEITPSGGERVSFEYDLKTIDVEACGILRDDVGRKVWHGLGIFRWLDANRDWSDPKQEGEPITPTGSP